MTALVLGPLLRYTGPTEATVWVETDQPGEVGIHIEGEAHHERTFSVEGHHYALVYLTGLEPAKTYEYEVTLEGVKVWPEEDSPFPPSVIRTPKTDGPFRICFGSCRVSAPHEEPYTLSPDEDPRGHGQDALFALARRMLRTPKEQWPDALLLLGDQIYADEVSPGTLAFIESRRDTRRPPGREVADFEEYTRLYRESWGEKTIRWLLSTVPSAMIFDDHDVHDDWNTSWRWVRKMRQKSWWGERITGAFMSYWIYQHLGNLSPAELVEDEVFCRVRGSRDAGGLLRAFARRADREAGGTRWSFHRDFGSTRLIMVDSRAGRVLEEGRRSMLDEAEWRWVEDCARGEFDHLLIGTSLPLLLAPGLHGLESASEAVCAGAWGAPGSKVGEVVRQALDLEHWAAFEESFDRMVRLISSVASGERSGRRPPASIVVLSGDVHHGYLAEMNPGGKAESLVYQAVGSPLRNMLPRAERAAMRAGWSRGGEFAGRMLARLAGVGEPSPSWWLLHEEPWFDNHVSTLEMAGRRCTLRVERPAGGDPTLTPILERRLA
ncbi:alkaline phosphatase D family protein [Rubrobacter calidifluminis]|uniref:alkaline phosphatase D family protein n=1 Tax=Rubrobacter calidifluminis TaxID=1392640 RepID=UPI0023619688|nr:alkaline phosphatase D family protein [Rubrobacter calidifluminis]